MTALSIAAAPRTDVAADRSVAAAPILAPGRNCWRIERAERLAFLVDGDEYFRAVREALRDARHSIFILGWDIDSRMRLVPDGANDGWPEPLGDFLNAIVSARRGLRAYVLSWDFAMLYMMEREWMPLYKLDWRTHRRLSFRLDARHPPAGSHHQKVIVVDDSLAFVSGFDLTRSRWDTCGHACEEPRRRNPSGSSYGPFHDVGALVEGACARAFGELARTRWERATRRRARAPLAAPLPGRWPASVTPDIESVNVAIARTEPRFEKFGGVAEVRELHLDAIAAAQREIFAENQYFTSRTIADAFAARLGEAGGPDIAVVSPLAQSGWLEVSTMGVLRARLHRHLKAVDRYGRYRLYCPHLPSLRDEQCLNVHSKVMTIDDRLAIVGSANLSDRSMGLDTECSIAIESHGDARVAAAIANLRNRLLGEHLDATPQAVGAAHRRTGRLIAAIESLHRPGERTLVAFDPPLDPKLDAIVPDHTVLDPEQPIDPDQLVSDLVSQPVERDRVRLRMTMLVAAVILFSVLAIAWRYTPLSQWLDVATISAAASAFEAHPLAPLGVLIAFIVGGLLLVPVMALIAATVLVFGPFAGGVYALLGALASAATTYALGRAVGRDAVRRLAGKRLNALSQRLGRQGLIAVTLVRLVPMAPFTVVNAVAGASHIGWRDFLLGTLLGMLPGITLTSAFVDRAFAAIRQPGPGTAIVLVAIVLIAATLLTWLRRRLARMAPAAPSDVAHVG